MVEWTPESGLPKEATTEALAALAAIAREAVRPVGTITVDMARGLARLVEQFPDVTARRGEALREGYREVLIAMPEDVALAVLREARQECVFIPVPAELKRIAARLMAPRVKAEAHVAVMALRRRQEAPRSAPTRLADHERTLAAIRASRATPSRAVQRFGGTAMDDSLDQPVSDAGAVAAAVRNGLIGASTFRLPPEDDPVVQKILQKMEKGARP